jgi:hypothetical protein
VELGAGDLGVVLGVDQAPLCLAGLLEQPLVQEITWVPRKANAEADALASTPLGPLRPKPEPSIDELPLD